MTTHPTPDRVPYAAGRDVVAVVGSLAAASMLLLAVEIPALGQWAVLAGVIVLIASRRGAAAGAYGALLSMALFDTVLAARDMRMSGGMNIAAMVGFLAVAVLVGSAPPKAARGHVVPRAVPFGGPSGHGAVR